MERERYQISLNYEGRDVQIIVDDIESAELLLNDNAAAEKVLENVGVNDAQEPIYLPKVAYFQESSINPISEGSLSNIMLSKPTSANLNTNRCGQNEQIWCKKKPTEEDLEATAQLLKLRQDLSSKFDDKKTIKSKLWQQIANNLKQHYNLGDSGAEKCRQKFANLQRAYQQYVRHQNTTGSEKNDDLPPFFEELHSILGSKTKINPTFLEDSFSLSESEKKSENNLTSLGPTKEINLDSSTEPNENIEVSEDLLLVESQNQPCTSNAHSDRFKTTRKKMKPTTKSETILMEMKKDRESQESHFTFFQTHLKKTEDQRDRFLDILENAFSKKRKRTDLSDSE